MDQNKLLECMEEIKRIAGSQGNRLTKDEISSYLGGMELSAEQFQAVYQYLGANQIQVEGYEYRSLPGQSVGQPIQSSQNDGGGRRNSGRAAGDSERKVSKAQKNLQRYRDEVACLPSYNDGQRQEMFRRFLSGESFLRNELAEAYLAEVIRLAQIYYRQAAGGQKQFLDEIIAEGNLGLMTALDVLVQDAGAFLKEDGCTDMEKIQAVMDMEIRRAMEFAIDDTVLKGDWEQALVAKTNLLYEAAKHLGEKFGRRATQEEISEFTKIPVDEIREIMDLSKDL